MKKVLIIMMLTAIMLTLAACSKQQDSAETRQSFTKAWIHINDSWRLVEITDWIDLRSNAVQITSENGDVYLTSYNNVILINEN